MRIQVNADNLMCAKCDTPMYRSPGECPHVLADYTGYVDVPDAQPTPEPVAPERRWEYRQLSERHIVHALNEGWEFAAPPVYAGGAAEGVVVAFLRRPVAEPATPAAGAEAGGPSPQSLIAQQMMLIANVIYERFPKDARDLRELAVEVNNIQLTATEVASR